MTEFHQRLQRVRDLFAVANREANALISDLSVRVGEQPPPQIGQKMRIIMETVAEFYSISVSGMLSNSRKADILEPRQVSMFLCRKLTEHGLETIGKIHGGRDHGTVIHAIRVCDDRRITDSTFSEGIDIVSTLCSERLASLDLPLFKAS